MNIQVDENAAIRIFKQFNEFCGRCYDETLFRQHCLDEREDVTRHISLTLWCVNSIVETKFQRKLYYDERLILLAYRHWLTLVKPPFSGTAHAYGGAIHKSCVAALSIAIDAMQRVLAKGGRDDD